MDAANFVCFWAEISGNLGPESSISGSKVEAQGPAILKCLSSTICWETLWLMAVSLCKSLHPCYIFMFTCTWILPIKRWFDSFCRKKSILSAWRIKGFLVTFKMSSLCIQVVLSCSSPCNIYLIINVGEDLSASDLSSIRILKTEAHKSTQDISSQRQLSHLVSAE